MSERCRCAIATVVNALKRLGYETCIADASDCSHIPDRCCQDAANGLPDVRAARRVARRGRPREECVLVEAKLCAEPHKPQDFERLVNDALSKFGRTWGELGHCKRVVVFPHRAYRHLVRLGRWLRELAKRQRVVVAVMARGNEIKQLVGDP